MSANFMNPPLPITAPRYYGFRAADPGFAWVFLQEAWANEGDGG